MIWENKRRQGAKAAYRWRCGRCRYLRASHGLRHNEYRDLVDAQEWVCAVCGHEDTLVIDHDHSCCKAGKSCQKCRRGLLCNTCNRMLGLGLDDPIVLLNGFLYLSGWQRRYTDDAP